MIMLFTLLTLCAAALARRRERIDRACSLHQLDDRTLADIGVHRSEIGSIEAEARGRFDSVTRRRMELGHAL